MAWYLYKHRENLPYLTYKAGSNDVPRYAVFKIPTDFIPLITIYFPLKVRDDSNIHI